MKEGRTIKVKFSFLKKISTDFLYTVSAVVILNIVQQILVQPYINTSMGSEYLGDVLFYLGLTYVFPQMFGTVLGHQRLLYKHNTEVKNGDFLILLGCYGLINFALGFMFAYAETKDMAFSLLFGFFMVLCLLRYYGQVEYRLNLNFKGYLIYFIIISVGYLVGLGVFQGIQNWMIIFVIGELMAVLYVFAKGSVFKWTSPGPILKKLWIPTTLLVISYLLSATSYLDRVIIQPLLGSVAVSEYYAASLVSKIINMLVQPLAILMLSYLADKEKNSFDLKFFKKITVFGVLGCLILTALCSLATPIAVYILYPNLLDVVMGINIAVNLGSVLGFAASMLMTFLLTEASIRYQLILRGMCFVIYLLSTVGLSIAYGVIGYAYASIVSNGFGFISAVVCGIYFYKKTGKGQ